VKAREDEKIEKYSQLASEIHAISKVETKCIPNTHRGFRNSAQEVAWFPEGPWDSSHHWVHANLQPSWFPAYSKECPEHLKFFVSVACVVVYIGLCPCPLFFCCCCGVSIS